MLRQLRQRPLQKRLHSRFAIKFVDVGVVPLVTRPVEIGQVREQNRSAREQRSYRGRRSRRCVPQPVRNRERGGGRSDQEQDETLHALDQSINYQPSTINPLYLRPWMKLPMHGLEPLLIDMRVNLRGGYVRVTEHFLDNAQVGAIA